MGRYVRKFSFFLPAFIHWNCTEDFIEFIKKSSMMEQIINGRNGLVLLGCHQAMVMKRTGDLYPLVRLPVSLVIYWPLDYFI